MPALTEQSFIEQQGIEGGNEEWLTEKSCCNRDNIKNLDRPRNTSVSYISFSCHYIYS